MNLLKHSLPSTVEVGGISFKVDTRYDTALAVIDCISDTLFPDQDRLDMALDMFYIDEIPPVRDVAIGLMFRFLNCGETLHESSEKQKKVIDFNADGNRIYTSFLRLYGIDLQTEHIHWWKFNAILQDLGEKTALQTVITIRTTDLSDVSDKNRAEYARLKREYAVDADMMPVRQETLEARNRRWAEGR